MGLSASFDEWCSDMALVGLKGIVKLVDDILIQAADRQELVQCLEPVLECCKHSRRNDH